MLGESYIGMGKITIDLHFCSEEEREQLLQYLNDWNWDFTEEGSFKDREDDEDKDDNTE